MGPTEHTHWELETLLSPMAVKGALVDFSPRRQVVWKETCHPAVYRVHAMGETWAEVTEGIRRAWSRERYDWSKAGIVTLTQLDSNIAEPVGTIRYTISPQDGGGAHVACERYRRFRGLNGRIRGTFMVAFGPRILRWQFRLGLDRVARYRSSIGSQVG
jgi:hypothetical protein